MGDSDVVEDISKEVEDEVDDDEEEEEAEEVEQTETESVEEIVKEKEVKAAAPPQMIGVQLLKDSDQTTSRLRKSRRRVRRVSAEV